MRLEVRNAGHGHQLAVYGPGNESAVYDFCDRAALIEHQIQYEKYLTAAGYSLETSGPERRSGLDRRQSPRHGIDRRRSPED